MAILPRLAARTVSTPPIRTAITRRASPLFSSPARRSYASQTSQGAKSSELPWMVGSVVLTVPALYYLLQSGPEEMPHGSGPHRSVTEEAETHREQKGEKDSSESEKPSSRDPPSATAGPESVEEKSGSQTGKQQGLSNTETKHPELDAPGKSVKLEGDTDSAKVKGTVSTERGSKED